MVSALCVESNVLYKGEVMNLKKPPHVTDKIWKQHMDWMELMDGQVQANREARARKISQAACTDEAARSGKQASTNR